MAGTIIVICAHSDDQVFGPGGTVAKLAQDGHEIVTVVLSYGELTHPWLKPEKVAEIRKKESLDADRIMKGAGVIFFDLKESSLAKDLQTPAVQDRLVKLMTEKPVHGVYTHAEDDPHPAHRDVLRAVLAAYETARISCPVYSFNVWNFLDFKKNRYPQVFVDISQTFPQKIKALRCFRSQINLLSHVLLNNILYLSTYARAFLSGIKHHTTFAEVFYRIR